MRTLLIATLLAVGCTPQYSTVTDETLEETGAPTDDTSIGDPIDSTPPEDTDNVAPLADAGPDQQVGVTDVVDLDGSASTDDDGDTLSYTWEFLSVPTSSGTNLINPTRVDPSFWADVPGTFEVQLTVDDGQATDSDIVEITVTAPNDEPVAYAGADITVNVGDTVQLNGSGSYDPDNDPLTYQWRFTNRPSGNSSALDDPTAAMPRFVASTAGNYTIELVVDDGTNSSQPDSVNVRAEDSDDGDCLSCTAQAEEEVRRRLQMGELSGGPLMVLLPLIVLYWQRRED